MLERPGEELHELLHQRGAVDTLEIAERIEDTGLAAHLGEKPVALDHDAVSIENDDSGGDVPD